MISLFWHYSPAYTAQNCISLFNRCISLRTHIQFVIHCHPYIYLSVQMLSRFYFLLDNPCFWLFSLGVLVYIFLSWMSFYCLPTYLTLLVSTYIIPILSDICKPPGLLSFVNFINVLFTSFSMSLVKILNNNRPKPYSSSKPAQYIPSLPAAYGPLTSLSIQVMGLNFKSIAIRFL